MTKTYLRVFLSFWLVTGLLLTCVFIYDSAYKRNPFTSIENTRDTITPAQKLLADFQITIANESLEGIQQTLELNPKRILQHLYVVDANNNDILNRPLPSQVESISAVLNDKTHDANLGKNIGRVITLVDGEAVKAITHINSNWRILFNVYARDNIPTLIMSVIISAIACWILAHKLSRDLNTLRNATRELASGDLSIRILPQFKGRTHELADLARDFDKMAAQLERSMLEQKRLIKDVSHELRSPLARLHVALSIAMRKSDSQLSMELEKIGAAADYLQDIITHILSIPVTEVDHLDMEDTIDLFGMIQSIIQQYRSEAWLKHVDLVLENHAQHALVRTQGNVLSSVFENIIRNAIHYTHEVTDIVVTFRQKSDQLLHINVSDHGSGVPEEDLDRIFQPFYRSDSARSRTSGGYGLGLAIAERTVRLHQGTIQATNLPEGGLSIDVFLPMALIDVTENEEHENLIEH
ncbi:ATP-binding protein [Marinibactrum halimedae]|uniref:histidine kinase n=1 Tax=Marinibactrum halimedae TaxID=1444977 RepID=A0AA37WNE5_9GAMM|nr:ATP-binding protein [Marinibactrum halimedae]MCD9458409.1 ATP-binding protein [Marinibactrum halimedae]GLS26106.1 two-component sensor histidine kinase [Marinibactrum halimedae]